MTQSVWFVTGCSSGFGQEITNIVLERGDKVIATARNLSSIETISWPNHTDDSDDNLRLMQLDLEWDEGKIKAVIDEAVAIWGRIDVLVNNAGYSVTGIAEEIGMSNWHKQFQANFFGHLAVTHALLPYMRKARSGIIVQMGSRKSRDTNPYLAAYSATKAALCAYSESLAQEIYQFNIKVLIVEPGAFKTKTVRNTQFRCENPYADYEHMRATFHKMVAVLEDQAYHGDPRKGMEVLVDIIKGEGKAKGRDMPPYVFLGEGSHEAVRKQIETIGKTAEDWKDITADLNFDSLSTK